MNNIIIAIIGGLCTAIPSIIATISTNKKNQDLIDYKISQLTEHVIQHNGLIDRMYKVENRVTLLEEKEK
jgi:hypothetical protein|uniref:Uncharacterized protein n=1 Tax=Siphoviridae sp. ctGQT3 TaxID=2825412 RepID=A0A8S5UE92_9CAUD|nr:MAG TPA: hypothetical protein [Siphoviridae sp. ctGQT3]DAP64603.1 MAG TPA: hypothetical protein [Caudoviricetes sp.]